MTVIKSETARFSAPDKLDDLHNFDVISAYNSSAFVLIFFCNRVLRISHNLGSFLSSAKLLELTVSSTIKWGEKVSQLSGENLASFNGQLKSFKKW